MTLTKRQLYALQLLRDEEDELIYERGQCWIGYEKFSARTFFALLRAMAIRHDPYSAKMGEAGTEVYYINETGKGILEAASPPVAGTQKGVK